MERLMELVRLVDKARVKKMNTLHTLSNGRVNPYLKLYRGLNSKEIASDEQASKLLNFQKKNSKYRMFKTRFTDLLLNSLFFIDFNKRPASIYTKRVYTCSRNMHLVRILLLLGSRNSAEWLAKKTITVALDSELTEVILACCKYLKSIYSLRGDQKTYSQYHTIFTKYKAILNCEEIAADSVDQVYLHFAKSLALKPEYGSDVLSMAKEIDVMRKKHKSKFLDLNYYRLNGLGYYILLDYKSSLKYWIELEGNFKGLRKFDNHERVGEAALHQLGCYLHLRDYLKGEICAVKCKQMFIEGTVNWFHYMEQYFILSMHSQKYKVASKIIEDVKNNSRFEFMSKISHEKWQVFQAYLEFIKGLGNPSQSKLKIHKLLNEVPSFSKDKKGFNVSILILQILYYLSQSEFSKIYGRIDALKRYDSRYLHNETTQRSFLLLKMLFVMEKAQFDYTKIVKKTKALFNELSNSSLRYEGNMDGMEVIPFEDLWVITLNLIENKS